jgi:hypothetical protein
VRRGVAEQRYKMRKVIFSGLFALFVSIISDVTLFQKERSRLVSMRDLIGQLQIARVGMFGRWPVDERELLYFVQEYHQDSKEGDGSKLVIVDWSGRVIYEAKFGKVWRIYTSYVLRRTSPQLAVEVGYGGKTNFLKILDYQGGRIVDLMGAVEPNNDFDVEAEVCPQFQDGVISYKEPFQVLLTVGVGLASPVEKYTKVFRYKDGAYHYIGMVPRREIDNQLERLLAIASSR